MAAPHIEVVPTLPRASSFSRIPPVVYPSFASIAAASHVQDMVYYNDSARPLRDSPQGRARQANIEAR